MDVCRAGGHWRRALQLFNRMSHQGIPPTTHTYALLQQAGAAARNSEAHEVYEAMKYAGIPAYLSYTAAAAKAFAYNVADQGKVSQCCALLALRTPAHSFVRLFVRSFIRSFICSFAPVL